MEENSETATRFIIPRESVGFIRLKETQTVIKSMKANNPEVLSLCVFGSNVKGRAKESSDIDGWLFVDALKVAEGLGRNEAEVVEVVKL